MPTTIQLKIGDHEDNEGKQQQQKCTIDALVHVSTVCAMWPGRYIYIDNHIQYSKIVKSACFLSILNNYMARMWHLWAKRKKKKCEEDVKKNINGQVTCTQAKYFHRNFYTK